MTSFRLDHTRTSPEEIEHLITLYAFLSQNNLLTRRNSGFKPLDSAMNQLLLVNPSINIAFLYISEAFDRIWLRGLIYKLKIIGIGGQLLKWLTDYQEIRRQRVVINGIHSALLTISAGVPQRLILGPLLFLVYVNDIVTKVASDIYLYTDDTIII